MLLPGCSSESDQGTNDVSSAHGKDPGPPLEDAYVAFAETIRARYPQTWIFLAAGPMFDDAMLKTMNARLKNVVNPRRAAGDVRMDTMDFEVQYLGKNGEVASG